MSEERYAPKWAKDQMERQERVIRVLGERVAELESGMAGDSRGMFWIPSPGMPDGYMRLGTETRHIKVRLPNGFTFDLQPASEGNGGIGTKDTVQIMVTSHHQISVTPQSANVIHFGPRR